MNNYTVLLLRPDYIADEFGKDTYLAHVTANGEFQAIGTAQVEARNEDVADADADDWPDSKDYHPLFCCLGHQDDLKP